MLQLLQLLVDVPLGVDGGLLAHPVCRHQVGLGLGHFNVVAKHLVVFHPDVLDAALLFGAVLDVHQQVLAVGHHIPKLVYLFAVPLSNDASISDGEGFIHQGVVNALAQAGQLVQLLSEPLEQGGRQGGQQVTDFGDAAQPRRESHQIPSPGSAVDNAADEPLQVGDFLQAER